MTKIVNSAAGNNLFTISGSAINSTNQPKLDGGAIAGINDTGKFAGYRPENTNPPDEYTSDQNLASVDTSPVITSDIDTNQVYKLRSVLQASAIRDNRYNFQDASWDNGYPTSRDDTEEIQLTTSVSTYPVDKAVGPTDRVTFKVGLDTPTTATVSG